MTFPRLVKEQYERVAGIDLGVNRPALSWKSRDRRSGLVPLHPLGARLHGIVVPLKPELLLAEHVGLEALPGLQLEVVERATLGAKPMRHAGGEKHQRPRFEFLGVVADL